MYGNGEEPVQVQQDELSRRDKFRVYRVLMVAGAIFVIGWLVWSTRGSLFPFFFGLVLAYLLAPGTVIAPVGGGLRLVEVTDVGQLGDAPATQRTVLVQARVRDAASRASYPVAYRLEVLRRDRWYVSGVQGALR